MQITPIVVVGISGIVLTVVNWHYTKNAKRKRRIGIGVIALCVGACIVAAITLPGSNTNRTATKNTEGHSSTTVTSGNNSPAIQIQGRGNAQVNSGNQTYNLNATYIQFGGTGNTMNVSSRTFVDMADEVLFINGISLQTNYCGDTLSTNFQIIPVKNREIAFTIENIGTVTAQHSCLNFAPVIPISMTNTIGVPTYWRGPFPAHMVVENESDGHIVPDDTIPNIIPNWIVEAAHSDPPQTLEPAWPVFVSTNFDAPAMMALIRLYADNSKMKEFQVMFVFH